MALVATGLVFRADPKNMIAGARLLRRHQRHQSLPGVGVLELPARDLQERADQAVVRFDRRGRHHRRAGRPLADRVSSSRTSAIPAVLYLGAACSSWRCSAAAAARAMALDGARGRLQPAQLSERDRALGGNPFAGFMLVMRKSPYLFGIMLFVIGVSAIEHIPVLRAVATRRRTVRGDRPSARRCSPVSMPSCRRLVVVSQLFLTGFMATRLGLTVLLVIVPHHHGVRSHRVRALRHFHRACSAMVIRRWGEYAFIRPGREMLFSRSTRRASTRRRISSTLPCTGFPMPSLRR